MTFKILQRVLADGTRFVVSKRGGQTVIQKFWNDGVLAETKVKKLTKELVGNKKVYTKDEFRYFGEQHFVTDAARSTTDRVYDESSNLLGIRRIIRPNTDSCEHNLIKIVENLKNNKTGYKQFLSPEGQIAKQIRFDNGIKRSVRFNPLTEGGKDIALSGGYTVGCYPNGIIFKEGAGLNLLF